jgi:coenzyme F420-0:L-glutamate ligase/coenzyme F420-1:gamma-L-glutamate ligase
MGTWDMQLRALPGIPMISAGDDLASIVAKALTADDQVLQDGDILVVAQKVVSKAEDLIIDLDTVSAGPEALALAEQTGRTPAYCQLVLDESSEVVAVLGRHIITVDRRGIVDTAGGVDSGNAGRYNKQACLLPPDPDASAQRIRKGLRELTGTAVGVIVSDSLGNPFRQGSQGTAIGLAGVAAVERPEADEEDLSGNPMMGDINRVDELAGAAGALMGQGSEARPVVLIRGAGWTRSETASIRQLLIPNPAGSFPLARDPQPS